MLKCKSPSLATKQKVFNCSQTEHYESDTGDCSRLLVRQRQMPVVRISLWFAVSRGRHDQILVLMSTLARLHSSDRYAGANPCVTLYIVKHSLKRTRKGTAVASVDGHVWSHICESTFLYHRASLQQHSSRCNRRDVAQRMNCDFAGFRHRRLTRIHSAISSRQAGRRFSRARRCSWCAENVSLWII